MCYYLLNSRGNLFAAIERTPKRINTRMILRIAYGGKHRRHLAKAGWVR